MLKRAKGQARNGERSEVCNGGSKDKERGRGGREEKKGGGKGGAVACRRRAVNLAKAQQMLEREQRAKGLYLAVRARRALRRWVS